MADNIVASVSRFLTPELIGKLTSAANLDRNVGQRAATAIVPAILSGLDGVAGTPAVRDNWQMLRRSNPATCWANSSVAPPARHRKRPRGRGRPVNVASRWRARTAHLDACQVPRRRGGTEPNLMGLLTPLIMGVLGRSRKRRVSMPMVLLACSPN
jgi:hypothetical protein